jgi:hypothetical protein
MVIQMDEDTIIEEYEKLEQDNMMLPDFGQTAPFRKCPLCKKTHNGPRELCAECIKNGNV